MKAKSDLRLIPATFERGQGFQQEQSQRGEMRWRCMSSSS